MGGGGGLHVRDGAGEVEGGLVAVEGPTPTGEAGALEMCLKGRGNLTLHFWSPSQRGWPFPQSGMWGAPGPPRCGVYLSIPV